MSHVRSEVPGGGHGGDDTGEEHSGHGGLRVAAGVQQHRGNDLVLRALPPSDSEREQPHQGWTNRAGDGAPCRQGKGLHRSQQAQGLRRRHPGLRGEVQQEQARPLHHAPRRRNPQHRFGGTNCYSLFLSLGGGKVA